MAANLPLPARLKVATCDLHLAVERTPFMASLLRGRLPLAAYCGLLRNLHPIYAALESRLAQHASSAALAVARLPGLARTASIEQDLSALHGSGWRAGIDVQGVAAQYARRVHGLAPPLLLAHAYVRYLGDLSGGQMLRTVVVRSFGFKDRRGTAFYDFGTALEGRELSQAFRAGLGGVVLDLPTIEAVVAEARLAFRMHQALFESLDSASAPANLESSG